MNRMTFVLLVGICLTGVQSAAEKRPREPVVGLPCEGCEAVFDGLPDQVESSARIASPDEPGQPLRIVGTVYFSGGKPAPGVIVYAYQTDAKGVYPRDENLRGTAAYRHGMLRAWVMSDDRGRYEFETIRPASYPGTDIPAHVHMLPTVTRDIHLGKNIPGYPPPSVD